MSRRRVSRRSRRHRHRRAAAAGQGHAGASGSPTHFGLRPSRHRPALPRGRLRLLARATTRPTPPPRSRRPRQSDRRPRRSRRCASEAGRPGRLEGGGASRRCAPALLELPARFRRPSAGGRAARCSTGATSARWSAPSADVKLFVTASPEARAERRYKELRRTGGRRLYIAAFLQDMKERDAPRQRTRGVRRSKPAPDAFVLDTTRLDADAAFAAALGRSSTRKGFRSAGP